MRKAIIVAAFLFGLAGSASAATGTLTGQTQISYGCPGPVAPDSTSCHPWHAFAKARFSVSPSLGQTRFVVSDAQGRFTMRLAPGSYTVKSLPQAHTRGGTTLRVQVRAGALTRILVRFQGFPMMM
jgi:hypothetical protein